MKSKLFLGSIALILGAFIGIQTQPVRASEHDRSCTVQFEYGAHMVRIFKGKGDLGDVLANFSVPYANNKEKAYQMIQLLKDRGQCDKYFVISESPSPIVEAPAKCAVHSVRTMSHQPQGAVLVAGEVELIHIDGTFRNQEKVLDAVSRDADELEQLEICREVSFDL